jgi:TRAP-type C4-dicarboxylate transport system permease small subunit
MENFEKISNVTQRLDKMLIFLALLCLCISAVGAVCTVALRYLFDISSQLIEEICRYTVIYGAFLYLGPLIKTNEHLKMSILTDYLKGKVKHINDLIISVIMFASFIFLLWSGIVWVKSLLDMGVTTVSGSMLLFIPTLAIPIGMLLGCIYSIFQILVDVYMIRFHESLPKSKEPEPQSQAL